MTKTPNISTKTETIKNLCGSANFVFDSIIETLEDFQSTKKDFGEAFAVEQLNKTTLSEKIKNLIIA